MNKKMLLIDVENCDIKIVEANNLEDYYKLIECRCIDIVSRTIGGKRFEIICDDEGLFKELPKISALDCDGNPMLVGNLLIAGGEVIDGELTSITDEEIHHITKHCRRVITQKYPDPYHVVCNMDY